MMEITNTLHSGMCRCCASEGTFKDIKTKYHWMGEEEVYADMLTDCFDIKICTPEDLDNGICEVCITQLRNAANFKKQVLHTEEQFKRRLQLKDVKNPIKLESVDEDPIESDHVSDPDFSGTEYEVPIKQEVDEKPKPRKRPAKATTSRAKKPKVEPESSKKRIVGKAIINKQVSSIGSRTLSGKIELQWSDSIKKPSSNTTIIWDAKPTGRVTAARENDKHLHNIGNILRYTNATPIRYHNSLAYVCAFCDASFIVPGDLKQHTLNEHDESQTSTFMHRVPFSGFAPKLDITGLQCQLCDAEIDELEEVLLHLRAEHEKKVYTDIKNQIIPFKFESKDLQCAVCKKDFKYFKQLLEHMNSHYRNYLCAICNAPYICIKQLKAHMLRHKQGEFPCAICSKIFDTEAKRNDHHKFVHMGCPKQSKCPYCSEKFARFQNKLKHMTEEHGEKPLELKCKACPLVFNDRNAFTRHTKRDHLMERPHQCLICDKKFFGKVDLRHHMVSHSAEREFRCDICLKAYARKKTLREHMRIHQDDRRFKCEKCGQTFVQKCSMKSHIKSRHSSTPDVPRVEVKKMHKFSLNC